MLKNVLVKNKGIGYEDKKDDFVTFEAKFCQLIKRRIDNSLLNTPIDHQLWRSTE